jgi:hypothetical protein
MEDSAHRFLRESHISAEWLLLWLREALAARLALKPLGAVPPESSLYHLDFAVVARQFGLLLSPGKRSKMTVGSQSQPLAKARG